MDHIDSYLCTGTCYLSGEHDAPKNYVQIFFFSLLFTNNINNLTCLRSNALPALPPGVLTLELRMCTPMDGPLEDPHDRDAQIARSLPVIR